MKEEAFRREMGAVRRPLRPICPLEVFSVPTRAPSVERRGIHGIVGERASAFRRAPATDVIGFGVVVPRGESVRVSSPVTEGSIQARRFGKSRRGKRMDVITMIAFHLARAASRLLVLCTTGCAHLYFGSKTQADKKESIVRSLACSDQQPRRIRCGQ